MSEEKKHDHENDKKLNIVMVVNGASKELEFSFGQKLRGIVEVTLAKTENTGQPVENWELRDEAGNILDLDKHLRDFSFENNVKLFLNPKAGIGG